MIYKMKCGLEYEIRQYKVEDAEILLKYMDTIIPESNNLTLGKGEFNMSLEKEEEFIKGIISSNNKIGLLAIYENEVVGNIGYSGGSRIRTKHCGELGIAIVKKYWNEGIGSELLKELINWAEKSKHCEKLNLKVHETNLNAISLYEKYGFVKEGLLINDMKIEGKYINSVMMGRIINK